MNGPRNPIGWCDYTWGIQSGCKNSCPFCYARGLANGRLKNVYLANRNIVPGGDLSNPFAPRFWPERLGEPSRVKKPSKIFVASMGELFGDWVPVNWVYEIFSEIYTNDQHIFQILTKFPENVRSSLSKSKLAMPKNIWLGITITGKESGEKQGKMGWDLSMLDATIKFVCFEPLLAMPFRFHWESFDWIIIGGKSGHKKFYPSGEWIEEIENIARRTNTPVFEKRNLRKNWKNLVIRQEFPKILVNK